MYLPPATPAQARAVYALLHVTPAMVRLNRLYVTLYFTSTALHVAVRLAFLSFGLSADFRNRSVNFARQIASFSIVRRLHLIVTKLFDKLAPPNSPFRRLLAFCANSSTGQYIAGFVRKWDAELARSVAIYYFLYTLVFTIFWSPLTYYEGFVLPHQYSLSHQPLAGWLGDYIKDTVVDTLIGCVSYPIVFWGISIFPNRWAIVLAQWSAPIILIGIFLNPFFDQIDNHFTRLPVSSPLYAPLHSLATRAGVPNVVILVADKSKQTDETNAYVTGIGSSAQIVLWDTLIKRMKSDEIIAITGHELGHYVEHHVIYGGFLAAIGMFAFLPAVKWLSDRLLARFGSTWQISCLADPAALPVLAISTTVLLTLISPLTNVVSRTIEHRADSFGLAVTGNRLAMARAQVDLANQNLEDPFPPTWEIFWLDDHPPAGARIRYALNGQPIQRLR